MDMRRLGWVERKRNPSPPSSHDGFRKSSTHPTGFVREARGKPHLSRPGFNAIGEIQT
jgi:hypothetical protein